MAFDSHKNFAYSLVATAPSPATSGTSLVVTTGEGSKFPTVPFNATVWPTGQLPTAANAEIVRVTNISTDTFTITRTQESSANRSILVGDQISATITKKTLDDIEGTVTTWTPVVTFATPGDLSVGYSVQIGYYTRVNNRVTLHAVIALNAFTHATATGNLLITGSPSTALNVTNFDQVGPCTFQGVTKANYHNANVLMAANSSQIQVVMSGTGQNISNVTASDTPSGGALLLKFSLTFISTD